MYYKFIMKGGDLVQDILIERLNNEQRKLSHFGNILINILKAKRQNVQPLIDLFEEITDSLSNAYVAVLNCYTKSLLIEAVDMANEVSFMVASFGAMVLELEEVL